MKKITVIVMLFTALLACKRENNTELSLIPMPNQLEVFDGYYYLKSGDDMQVNDDFLSVGHVARILYQRYNIQLEHGGKNARITIMKDERMAGESYQLVINEQGIAVKAGDYNGFFYAFETFLQLVDQAEMTEAGMKLPFIVINDAPAYAWRGMHLDVARHFHDVAFVKKMLNAMAAHKLNTFHWHLTDDQGWRIEIEKYPKLTEIGAWRDETLIGHASEQPERYDGKPYGGYYTKKDIKEVVAHAKRLGITIVPEIEMPGHAVAALLAYPELSCNGEPETFNRWGISEDVFCAGNEATFEFLENVLSEVIELFPGEYIHVGGDECPKNRWVACPKCQQRIADEGLNDEHELQSYFIQRMEKYLNARGKKLIGWDEILEGGLAENAAVMSWRGEEGGIEAASMGHHVVMSPNDICYLDHYQADPAGEPLAIGGLTTMEDIYNWSPTPEKLAENKRHFILGGQANVWTEYMPESDHVEYMVFPRLSAMSEVLWTKQENRDYNRFLQRMEKHYQRLGTLQLNYRKEKESK